MAGIADAIDLVSAPESPAEMFGQLIEASNASTVHALRALHSLYSSPLDEENLSRDDVARDLASDERPRSQTSLILRFVQSKEAEDEVDDSLSFIKTALGVARKSGEYALRKVVSLIVRATFTGARFAWVALRGSARLLYGLAADGLGFMLRYMIRPIMAGLVGLAMSNPVTAAVLALAGASYIGYLAYKAIKGEEVTERPGKQSIPAAERVDVAAAEANWWEQLRPSTEPVATVESLGRVSGASGTSVAFRQKVMAIGNRLGVNPLYLMAAMSFESGFNPALRNPRGTATGLIQFTAPVARRLGTSVDQLARMSAEQQLDYVERYFSDFRGRLHTLEDVYMAVLWPAAVGRGDDYVLFRSPSPEYIANRELDIDHSGTITAAEATAFVQRRLPSVQPTTSVVTPTFPASRPTLVPATQATAPAQRVPTGAAPDMPHIVDLPDTGDHDKYVLMNNLAIAIH